MYIMYHLLRAAGPPLPQNIMAFSNQIDFETDPQGKCTLIFQATSAIFVQDHHSTQGDLTQIFPTFLNAIVYSYSIQKRQPLSLAILGPFLVIFLPTT